MVPPPMSATTAQIVLCCFLTPGSSGSEFNQSSITCFAATVGSLTIFIGLRPAMWPASIVAFRCASSNCAGTLITTSLTGTLRYFSATSAARRRINALTNSGWRSLFSPLQGISIAARTPFNE